MKHANKILLISLTIVFLSLGNIFAQTNSFYVYVKQNGKKVNIKKNQIEILKQAFEIYVEYTEKVDLTVHSSFNGKIFNDAFKGHLLLDLIDTESQNARISIFKKKNILKPDNDITYIWEKDKTDCDSIQMIGNRHVSVKRVEHIVIHKPYFDEEIKKVIDVDMTAPIQFVKDDIYLVFLYTEKDKSGENTEIQREILKIKWVDIYKEETEKFKKNSLKESKTKVKEAERKLKYKQKLEKKEKKNLEKLEKSKKKREEKEEKKRLKKEKKNKEN